MLKSARPSLPPQRTCAGLTLLEMVVVLAVLAALATMLVPMLDNIAVQSRQIATQQTLRQIQESIVNRYASDMKGYTFYDTSGTAHFVGTASGTIASVNYGLPVPDPQNLATDGSTTRNGVLPQLAFLSINPLTNDQTSMGSFSTSALPTAGWHGPYMSSGSTFPAPAQTMPNGRTAQSNGFYDPGTGAPLYGMTSGTGTLSGWTDPTPVDAWGSPIVIQGTVTNSSPYTYVATLTSAMASGSTILTLTTSALVSAGPDGVLNTTDDVTLKLQ